MAISAMLWIICVALTETLVLDVGQMPYLLMTELQYTDGTIGNLLIK